MERAHFLKVRSDRITVCCLIQRQATGAVAYPCVTLLTLFQTYFCPQTLKFSFFRSQDNSASDFWADMHESLADMDLDKPKDPKRLLRLS